MATKIMGVGGVGWWDGAAVLNLKYLNWPNVGRSGGKPPDWSAGCGVYRMCTSGVHVQKAVSNV